MTVIIETLSTNTTVNDIIRELDHECQRVPVSLRNACIGFGKALGKTLKHLPKTLAFEEYAPYSICSIVGECIIPCCKSDEPEQIQIQMTGIDTEMGITWVTPVDTLSQTPCVEYNEKNGKTKMTKCGSTSTYTFGGWKGTINHVVLENLKLRTTYDYKVNTQSKASSTFEFVTPPYLNEKANRPLRIAVIGDMGASNASDGTVARLTKSANDRSIDFILHDGDTSYADGVQFIWDQYYRKVQPYTTRLPVFIVPGNHEIADDFAAYKHRHFMPSQSSKSGTNMYWSANVDNVHIVGVSSESEFDTAFQSPHQLAWLEQDLKSVDRQKTPWIILMLHRPLYCSSGSPQDCKMFAGLLRSNCESMLKKYNVDIVIQAHRHDYESSWPVYDGIVTQHDFNKPSAPTYIVVGASGCREGMTSRWDTPPPQWSRKRILEFGYATIDVYNSTYLEWKYIGDSTGNVLDQINISK
eukprot:CAMPEP_0168602518 /NCGR_PEP_ID=MMETSP0420-20121227/14150_1 /TAXON_ID=498008 /ORGANISM="Pessonella sp." /LENGTH=468 /DNA_ID=CAMNT_0008641261 /DNA_START=167 /DNA_END=1573 /DNA_ORIENTATION=-